VDGLGVGIALPLVLIFVLDTELEELLRIQWPEPIGRMGEQLPSFPCLSGFVVGAHRRLRLGQKGIDHGLALDAFGSRPPRR